MNCEVEQPLQDLAHLFHRRIAVKLAKKRGGRGGKNGNGDRELTHEKYEPHEWCEG